MTIEGRNDGGGFRRIRLGMIGGGEGAFIGAVHRIAARLDDRYVFLAGALSATPAKARRSGRAIGLDKDRAYPDYETMLEKERARPDGIEAVAIVTPNHMHAPAAAACLRAGLHVICDKPLATTVAEGKWLKALLGRKKLVFAVTYNYTGYPMVRQARAMVESGALGRIRLVQVEYPQEWLTTRLEKTGQKQAEWRTDPKRSGRGGAIGDIGTHAFNLAEFVSGLSARELLADLTTFVPGRQVDDNVQMLLRFGGGARGMLWASQVAPGYENGLRLRVYGEKGGLDWLQAEPNYLRWSPYGKAIEVISRGGPTANAAASRVTRIPGGHPEGYLEAFATLYTEIAAAIRGERDAGLLFPRLADGVRGLEFIDAGLKSAAKGGRWQRIG